MTAVITVGALLEALRRRGRVEEAASYEQLLTHPYCPPFTVEEVKQLPFDEVCTALELGTLLRGPCVDEPLTGAATRGGGDVRLGVYWLQQTGRHPERAT